MMPRMFTADNPEYGLIGDCRPFASMMPRMFTADNEAAARARGRSLEVLQ